MKEKSMYVFYLGLVYLFSILLLPQIAVCYEVMAMGVSYDGADPCNAGALHPPAPYLSAIEAQFESLGASYYPPADARTASESNVMAKWWTQNRSPYTWGRDTTDEVATDWADVFIFVGHSTSACNDPNFPGRYFSQFVMGNSTDTCRINTDQHMQFGPEGNSEAKGDLNYFITSACNSAQDCVFEGDGYFTPIQPGSTTFSVWNGHHGAGGFTPTGIINDYENYIISARNDGIGDDWVDIFTKIEPGVDNDHCAVSIIYRDAFSAPTIYYYGGFKDFLYANINDGDATYYKVSGCDPAYGDPL